MDLTNEQWQRIAEYIPKPKAQPGKSGRPPQDCRAVLNGVLWILRTGAPWGDLPERFSNGINHPTNDLYDQMAQCWFEGIMGLQID